jgi:hypothetical protein
MPGSSTSCGVAVCLNGFASSAPQCNSNGVCLHDPAPAQCYPFACDPTTPACITTCGSDADCAPHTTCVNGGCRIPSPPDAGTDGGAGAGTDASVSTGGAAGAGGTGTGGRGAGGTATGGQAGSAGAGGTATGGSAGGIGVGTGGTSSLDGGTTGPDAGKDGGTAPGAASGDEGSCGCRVVGRESGSERALLGALAGLALVVARRRGRGAALRGRGAGG